jgi:DNA-binding CsgD family transcriptional regulator
MRWHLPARAALVLVVAVQALCTLFFVWDILAGVVGLPRRPLSWRMREIMEMGAGVGLVLGVALGAVLLFTTLRQNRSMETQLRQASGAFAELLEERFRGWGLTPSERDVAWFTIKGLSIADIARLRQTSEGTVKAQSNAIYRKAGVSGRAQLVSLCIEDLIDAGPLAGPEQGPAKGGTRGRTTA